MSLSDPDDQPIGDEVARWGSTDGGPSAPAGLRSGRQRVRIVVRNAPAVKGDLRLLAEAAERFPKVRQMLLDLGDLSLQIRCVQLEPLTTAGACEVPLRLELSDRLTDLVRAVRAGDVDCG